MNFENLTRYLDSLPGTDCAPGVDCKITLEGKEIYRHSAGWNDLESKTPISKDTRYFMYSVTKPLTCITALTLYEKGMYLLTDPLDEYIPEFRDMYVKHTENGEDRISKAKNKIRIVDLFTMSAGFNYDIHCNGIQRVKDATKGAFPTLKIIQALADEPLEFEPGTGFMYSLCHDVLGALVEVITGKSFGQYMKEAILEPLEMYSTGFIADNDELIASQYRHNLDDDSFMKIEKNCSLKLGTEYESGGAGLISTVDDYSKFTTCIANDGFTRNGKSIISKATINLMQTNHLNSIQLTAFRNNNAPHRIGYGYGLGVRTMIDPIGGGINGSLGEMGWPGSGGSYILIDPLKRLSVVFAEHTVGSLRALHKVHPRLRNIIYSSVERN